MTSLIVSSLMPFPNIGWWLAVLDAGKVCFDTGEHFEKMSYRNKYFISGANGIIQLSIPLQKGREQRTPMCNVLIDNNQRWQIQHWRSIVSAYKRTPYFEHYEPGLQFLFETRYDKLADFNMTSINWLKKQLGFNFVHEFAEQYSKHYPAGVTDLRHKLKPSVERTVRTDIPYYQVFSDKNGFAPNLSMLDLLFIEGPYAAKWLKEHKEIITAWTS